MTVNILERLVGGDQQWAKLAGIPGMVDGWQGLSGTLEASLLEFQVRSGTLISTVTKLFGGIASVDADLLPDAIVITAFSAGRLCPCSGPMR